MIIISLFLSNYLDASLFLSTESKKSSRSSIVIEVVVGGSILLLVILLAGVYVLHTKKRAERAIEHTNHFCKMGFCIYFALFG